MKYKHVKLPQNGEKISVVDGKLHVPDNPVVGYIEGDGIGPDITRASLRIWDAAVAKAYDNRRKINSGLSGRLRLSSALSDRPLIRLMRLCSSRQIEPNRHVRRGVGFAVTTPSTSRSPKP